MNNYHDNHYAEMKVQPLEVMQELMLNNEFRAFIFGNVIKYHLRAGHKQGETINKDIDKRDRYLSWLQHLCNGGDTINPKKDYELDDVFKNSVLTEIDKKREELTDTHEYMAKQLEKRKFNENCGKNIKI